MIRLILGSFFAVVLVLLGSGGVERAQAQMPVDLVKLDMQLTPVYTLKCIEDWPEGGDELNTFGHDKSKACEQLYQPAPRVLLVAPGPIAPPFNGDDDGDMRIDEDPKGDCNGDGSNDDDGDQLADEDDGSVNTLYINCPAKWPDLESGRFVQLVRGFIGIDNDGDTYVDEDGAGRYDFNGDTTVDIAENDLENDPVYVKEQQYQDVDDDLVPDAHIDEDPIDCLLEDTVSEEGEPLYSECFYQVKQILLNNPWGPPQPVLAADNKYVDCPDQTSPYDNDGDSIPDAGTEADTATECGVHYSWEDYNLYDMGVSAAEGVPMYAKPFNPNPDNPLGYADPQGGPPPYLDCEAPKIPVGTGYFWGYPYNLTINPVNGRPPAARGMLPGDCFMVDSVAGMSYEMDVHKMVVLWPGEPVTIQQQYVVGCIEPGMHKFLLHDEVWPATPEWVDIDPGNNMRDTDMLVACTLEGTPGDEDGDTVPDDTETNCGSLPKNPASIPERLDGVFAGVDDDLDTAADEALPPGSGGYDCDGDGWAGDQEKLIFNVLTTVNDQDPCGNNGWPADLAPDLVGNNILNIGDINSFTTPPGPDDGHGTFNYFFHTVPDLGRPNSERWNLDQQGAGAVWIDVGDMNAINPGVAASTSRPPMFGGQPAFFTNGGQCPWPP